MLRLSVETQPPINPITVDDVKAQSIIDHDLDDSLISSYITAARQWCEGYLNRALITTRYKMVLDAWPVSECLDIPRPPLVGIESFTYIDKDDNSATLTIADTFVVSTVGTPGRIALKDGVNWPTTELRPIAGIEIVFDAGYGSGATDVPEAIRQAVKLVAADLYENRESSVVGAGLTVAEVPFGAKALLNMFRVDP